MRKLDEKAKKTAMLLEKLIVKSTAALDGFKIKFCDYKTNNIIPDIDSEWDDVREFIEFNKNGDHFWIRGTFTTPPKEDGISYALQFKQEYTGRVQTILYLNGEMVQGLDENHERTLLESETTYDAAFYCYMDPVYATRKHFVSSTVPKLLTICDKTEKLYYDFEVPYEAAEAVEKNSDEYNTIIHHLEIAANLIDFREPYTEEYYKSVNKAITYLAEEFYEKECGKGDAVIQCLGHSHIDIAWRWPVRQTVEKVQRSFSTVLYLMKHYPEYIFMITSPQMYEFMKREAPEKYEEIKERVKEGRWEVDGAMWLEADGNLPSGESFVRQLIYGKKFIKEEFGVESRTLWIPDVFGYSASLPQILKKAGVERFFTSKMSWNDTEEMPHDTFYWRGIDGSEIFTQLLTTKYFAPGIGRTDAVMLNGVLDAKEVKSAWDFYREKEYNDVVLHTFGYGDGGGGRTYEMLERYRRLEKGIPGIPKTKMCTADEFFNSSKENFDSACKKFGRVPKWTGEMYLQFHRGTYTAVAKTKKANRVCEFMLGSAEQFSVMNMLLKNAAYPENILEDAWKKVLLNQFHDIIPGSCIKEVTDVAEKEYNEVKADCKKIMGDAFETIASDIKSGAGYAVFNPLPFEANGIVDIEGSFAYTDSVPSHGYRVLEKLDFTNSAEVSENSITNKYFVIKLDKNGEILSIYDRVNSREILSGKGNRFVAYEDRPLRFDGWELTHYYKQKPYYIDEAISIMPYENGAKKGLTIIREFMNSKLSQNIIVYDNVPRIDFETVIDWKEEQLILKTLFPVDILSDKVTADIQFGSVERPTHTNTGWDEAQFEMCMHKWMDISDNGYSVSFLNDCKYGFSCDENMVGITMLKCGTDPDPDADKYVHEFTYSLYAHSGRVTDGDTVKEAYLLNNPMSAVKKSASSGNLPESYSLVNCDKKNVIVETIKKSEAGRGIIVRMFENSNMTTGVTLSFGFDIKKAYVCDLLENVESEVEVNDNKITIPVKNFEIVTLMLELK